MALKVKKEVPAPPRAEAKAKVLKAAKAGMRGIHTHKSPTFWDPRHCGSRRSLNVFRRPPPGETSLTIMPSIIRLPTAESAMKTEDNHTLVFTVDTKANECQVKQAVKKLCDIDVAKVNSLIRPGGEKQAYIPLFIMLWMLPTRLGSS
ncbi:hypothetical protein H8958_019407, partial [Nasalis larvatus]